MIGAGTCPVGGERRFTDGEIALARTIFGDVLDYAAISIRRRKFFPLQPRKVTMAPRGHLHFHPQGEQYCDDFSTADFGRKGLFIHELTHVWQTQQRGEWYLVLHRHPWCRYDYSLKPGQPLHSYGIEQQAEIVRHAFLLRNGMRVAGVADQRAYDALVRFPGATLG
ncbi:vgr related protein [Altererythrobacter xixiisoli]|uniref:Vgr related protein n=1 Tax=Croceibacterium xixiisoli TaxID=1476466 RepID=A0A6I4TZ90_9SPHN|nr:vgr related protein [Croceibacterium xixiisoli]MXP00008.1 vgr related protein [Croceibacterium xixiisoli]